jgi:hypothetical protein
MKISRKRFCKATELIAEEGARFTAGISQSLSRGSFANRILRDGRPPKFIQEVQHVGQRHGNYGATVFRRN